MRNVAISDSLFWVLYKYIYILFWHVGVFISQAFVDTYSSKAIWLLFLNTNTSLEQYFTDINIPFNCQFLVAQPQNDHVVMLTEVYRVSPTLPLQIYSFGNWTAGGGLTWPSQSLYRRRNNLQGHTIQAAQHSVREICTTCENFMWSR